MSDGIYSALSGAIAQERNLTVVANNVANVNTTGYKGDKTIFAEALNKAKVNSTQPTQPSLKYAVVDSLSMDNSDGSLKQTGRPLDVAIQGNAYFTLETSGGDRYTRAGSFVLDRDGVMRTTDGFAVVKEIPVDQAKTMARKMIIPQDTHDIQINPDGTVNADGVQVGKIQLAHFDSQDQLTRDGLTRFAAKAGVQPKSPPPTVTTEQGYLEAANVNAIAGMNELIIVNRSFEALQKVIDTFHDLDDRTARDVAGKV